MAELASLACRICSLQASGDTYDGGSAASGLLTLAGTLGAELGSVIGRGGGCDVVLSDLSFMLIVC